MSRRRNEGQCGGQRLLLPPGFDVAAIVHDFRDVGSAQWLVSIVFQKCVAEDVDAQGYTTLSAAILQCVMGERYAKIVNDLIRARVMERSNLRPGLKSYGYRLTAGLPLSVASFLF